MEEGKNILLFDDYISNSLTDEEKHKFEIRLTESEEFRAEFESYKNFKSEISDGFEYITIRKKLDQIHYTIKKSKKSILLKPKFLIPFAAAASISLLIILNLSNLKSDKETAYSPLSNVGMEASEDNQSYEESIVVGDNNSTNTLNDSLDNNIPLITKLPRGTAFLISNNGYFLTSKHLVLNQKNIILQQKKLGLTFETEIIYIDSLTDLAVLRCSRIIANQCEILPYHVANEPYELGDDVFSLGYPKEDIVYTKGVISSENGFRSDSNYFEVSLPSNAGQSGSPLFNINGEFIGIITAKHAEQQMVTYALKLNHLQNILDDSITLQLYRNSTPNVSPTFNRYMIKAYSHFVFEVH